MITATAPWQVACHLRTRRAAQLLLRMATPQRRSRRVCSQTAGRRQHLLLPLLTGLRAAQHSLSPSSLPPELILLAELLHQVRLLPLFFISTCT